MNQALRGLALTALTAGQDISRADQPALRAARRLEPRATSGAPTSSRSPAVTTFTPATTAITAPSAARPAASAAAQAPRPTGTRSRCAGRARCARSSRLLRSGVAGEMAEAPFTSTTGGAMPAGTLIFPNDASTTIAAIHAAGLSGRDLLRAERRRHEAGDHARREGAEDRDPRQHRGSRPSRTRPRRSRRSSEPTRRSSRPSTGADSLQNAATDPLAGYDVIYNTGQGIPGHGTSRSAATGAQRRRRTRSPSHDDRPQPRRRAPRSRSPGSPCRATTARGRSRASRTRPRSPTRTRPRGSRTPAAAHPSDSSDAQARAGSRRSSQRGGGYIGTSVSGRTSRSWARPADRTSSPGAFTQTSDGAGGGMALWNNSGGSASPITGGYPAQDTLYLPSQRDVLLRHPDGRDRGRPLSRATRTRCGSRASGAIETSNRRECSPMAVHGTTNVDRPLHGPRDEPVLPPGRRAGVDDDRPGGPLGHADRRGQHGHRQPGGLGRVRERHVLVRLLGRRGNLRHGLRAPGPAIASVRSRSSRSAPASGGTARRSQARRRSTRTRPAERTGSTRSRPRASPTVSTSSARGRRPPAGTSS